MTKVHAYRCHRPLLFIDPTTDKVSNVRATSVLFQRARRTDNGSCYTARNTRAFAWDIGLIPRTTPVSSPQSNGMAEAFVRTLKRDYVRVNPRPNAQSVID